MDSPNRKKGLGKIIGGFGLIILVPIIVSVLTPPFQTPLTGYVLTTVVSFIVGCILIMYGTMQLSRIKRLDNQTGTVEADTAIKKPSLAKIIVPLVILVILSFVLLTLQFPFQNAGIGLIFLWGIPSAVCAVISCIGIIERSRNRVFLIFTGIIFVLFVWALSGWFFMDLYWKFNPS